MNTLVIDASIAVKWVVEEDGTTDALALRQKAKLIAPELLVAECANILWKKVQRNELMHDEALLAARLLQGAEIELLPMRSLLESATQISIEIDHPAYDCLYLALAVEKNASLLQRTSNSYKSCIRVANVGFATKRISLIEAARL